MVTPSVVGSCVVDNLVLSSCSVVVSWVVSLDVSSGVTAVDSLDVNSITVVVTSLTAVVSADVTAAVVVAGPKITYAISFLFILHISFIYLLHFKLNMLCNQNLDHLTKFYTIRMY